MLSFDNERESKQRDIREALLHKERSWTANQGKFGWRIAATPSVYLSFFSNFNDAEFMQ